MNATLHTARVFDTVDGYTVDEKTFSSYEQAERWGAARAAESDVELDYEVEMNTYG